MGILDFFWRFTDRLGYYISGEYRLEEASKEIKSIYTALEEAERDLRNFNETSLRLKKKGKNVIEEEKLHNKVSILSKLKRDINKILREF